MGTPSTTPINLDVAADVIHRAAKAFNDHDAQAFTAVMAPDVEFIHSALPEPMHGRAEVATTYSEQFWRAFPDLTIELADGPLLHPNAPRAAVDWRVRGTHLGPLDPPGLAPTGLRSRVNREWPGPTDPPDHGHGPCASSGSFRRRGAGARRR